MPVIASAGHDAATTRGLYPARMRTLPLIALSLLGAPLAAAAADDIFAGRPAFSAPEQPPVRPARCEEIRRMSAGMPEPESRIDFAVTGPLTVVKTDGALWYLLMCQDVRVLCVTYESNDMKAGDVVTLRGGYNRRDADHIMLDPCLAGRDGAETDAR